MGIITNRFLNDVSWKDAVTEPSLSDAEVHVFRISISRNINRLKQFEALLTTDEKLRAGKYRQQKDTYRFIVSRGAQRIILGKYTKQPPAGLQFVLGYNKKPYLVSNDGSVIHYNPSHSGDWIVLAIATSAVGADVEQIDHTFPFDDILTDNFSVEEIRYISTSAEKFFTLWTRKEAYLKATGQGLGDHLPVTPALDGEHQLDRMLTGSDNKWQLNSFMLADGYTATVVVEEDGNQLLFFEADL